METEKWSHKIDYLLTVAGFMLGVGAVWKFPYICARNGGGSFLIPFAFFLLIGAFPLTFLENMVGQFSQQNCLEAWDICPAFKGIGVGSLLVSALFFTYYPVLLSWMLYYLVHSFSAQLPWTLCNQPWNTDQCFDSAHGTNWTLNSSQLNYTRDFNGSLVPAAEEFFWYKVLQITDSLENIGSLRWPLVGGLFVVFLTIYLCIAKGIRVSGKIVYVTVLLPYVLVTMILVKACTLPGSLDGVLYFITPDFDRLKDPATWMEACSLAIFLMCIGFGSLVEMASHNPTTNNCLRDAITLNSLIFFSMIFFGFSVFAITGHLAHQRGLSMDSYSSSGFKLGFISFPEATSLLPIPQLWSVILYLMLLTLGIDSAIPPAEVIASVVGSFCPRLKRKMWLLNALIVTTAFLFAVPLTTQGGVYILTLIDWFSFFPSLILFGTVESIAVAWIYGTNNVNRVLYESSGQTLPRVIAFMWRFTTPLLLLVVLVYSFYSYRPPTFEDYVYKPWANVIGWFLSMGIVSPVPVYFLWSVWKAPGDSVVKKIKSSIRPQGRWKLDAEEETEMEQETEVEPLQTETRSYLEIRDTICYKLPHV